jgi:hypothetical protein
MPIVALDGVTLKKDTSVAVVTVAVAVAVKPFEALAVIVTVPVRNPLSKPEFGLPKYAILSLEEDHVTVWFAVEGKTVAVSGTSDPTPTIMAAGLILIETASVIGAVVTVIVNAAAGNPF